MELSIIIVSYNVRHFLEQCLRSVNNAAENIDCEIFVVDNNSADGSCAMVRNEYPAVNLIMNNKNLGFSAANNQAIKVAAGRFILLLNPDTIVEEGTFKKCIAFMDSHPDAGAVGVRMIDGKGRFLQESKRALPTPGTAFFKIFGFSTIFPRSGLFNRYYLGNIDSRQTAPADIISGAFMFIRREAVIKTGLLDEDYFMYGEDVDYSYRLKKAGYNNYYFPEIQIIHYKGQSTRKDSLNVMINFYKAMRIFVSKHFANGSLKAFVYMIRLAIIFRASLSLLKQIVRKIFLPVTDGILIYLIFLLITRFWANYRFGTGYSYPETFTEIILPAYVVIIIFSAWLFSGYKPPARTIDTIKGVIAGTVMILLVYALLPLDLRFSRAIILLGILFSVLIISLSRFLFSLILPELIENPFPSQKNTLIVADHAGYERINELLLSTGRKIKIVGRVSIQKDDMLEEVLGNIGQMDEIIRVNRIKEVIFSTRELTASQIIESTHLLSEFNVGIRIASADEKYLLGTRHVNPEAGIIRERHTFFRKK